MTSLLALMTALTLTIHVRTISDEHAVLNTCTAVFVGPQTVLTAAHCIHGGEGMKGWGKDSKNKSFTLTLEAIDVNKDLALLHVKGPVHPYARLGTSVGRTDRIYTLNSGEDMIQTYAEGVVANLVLDPITSVPLIVHTAPILPGASGSGLFDKRGRLVGINVMTQKVFSLAVDLVTVHHFLEDAAKTKEITAIQGA